MAAGYYGSVGIEGIEPDRGTCTGSHSLWVRRNRYDRYLPPPGAVVPEYSVRGRSTLLCISFEDFLSVRSPEGPVLMGMQARMSWI